MSKYTDYLALKERAHDAKFDSSGMAPQFVEAFNNGNTYRVCVDFGYTGSKPVWGYVGVTTGWKPVFLLMRRRGQHGSSEILTRECKILATRWIK